MSSSVVKLHTIKLKGSDNLQGPFSCLKSRRHAGFWLPVQRVVNHAPITSLFAKKHHRLAFAFDAGGVWRLSRGHRCDRSRVQEAGGPAESGAKRGDPAATATGPPTTHETPRDDGILKTFVLKAKKMNIPTCTTASTLPTSHGSRVPSSFWFVASNFLTKAKTTAGGRG